MIRQTAYSYTTLRYVHDVVTGEFVNVGVVLFAPATGAFKYKVRTTVGRLKGVFPDIDRASFGAAMQAMRRGFEQIAREQHNSGFLGSQDDAAAVARKAVTPDDSALQLAPCGTGLTEDPDRTLNQLYDRLVARYDVRHRQCRSDEDVWRPVRQQLAARNLADRLQATAIRGTVDDIVFPHAWKNGQWRVYEPISFDLADADGIKAKARERLGHLSAVVADGAAEPFKAHFIVGAPQNQALMGAFQTAIAILQQAPNHPAVFQEHQIDVLVAQIEDEVRAHIAERKVATT